MFSNAAMETWNRTCRDFEIVREVDHVCGVHLDILYQVRVKVTISSQQ